MEFHQIDCFKINMKFWKFLAVWPDPKATRFYHIYCKCFLTITLILYNLLFTINFYFLPRQLDSFIDDLIFYFTELTVMFKALTIYFMHGKIVKLLKMLECETFQPNTADGLAIIVKAKRFNKIYWRIVATVSFISHYTNVITPVLFHIIFSSKLNLPICNYYFISEEVKEKYIYALYCYQSFGMHFHMLYNVNIDTFFLGLMILAIAQLDILNQKLRKVADHSNHDHDTLRSDRDDNAVVKINDCIKHFDEISKFCQLIQDVFSVSIFIQFSMASSIICVCLFRFTLPAPTQYYIFLVSYMFIMIIQILVPCFYGTRIIDKSSQLSFAVYTSNWTPRCQRFKRNLRLFVERANKPLCIIGGKMFLLSLTTFTSIMNSAYSFFTLLQYMKSRD